MSVEPSTAAVLEDASADEDPIEVVVTAREPVASRVLSFALEPAARRGWRPYAPGSHVDLFLPTGDIRQYSLVSPGGQDEPLRFAVLKTDDSRGGSRLLHEWLRPGHRLRVSQPKNNFALDEDADHSVLIAGGIGVTPLLAMARRLQERGRSFEVHYRARSRDRAAFADELAALTPAGRFHLVVDSDLGPAGFTPEAVIAEAGLDSTLYVCGPEPFMDFVRRGAEVAGMPSDRVREEHFKHEVKVGGPVFTLHAARSGVSVEIGSDQTAAAVLAEAGVFVPTACGQGVCGTCIAKVVKGVPDHRDVYLTPTQKRKGDVMTLCCSRAATESITIDI